MSDAASHYAGPVSHGSTPTGPARLGLVGATGLIGRRLIEITSEGETVRIVGIARREASLPKGARVEMFIAKPAKWGEVLEAVRKASGSALVSVALFDRYAGEGIPNDKVSLAFRLVFQRNDRTLRDAEVTGMIDRIVKMLAHRFDGQLR